MAVWSIFPVPSKPRAWESVNKDSWIKEIRPGPRRDRALGASRSDTLPGSWLGKDSEDASNSDVTASPEAYAPSGTRSAASVPCCRLAPWSLFALRLAVLQAILQAILHAILQAILQAILHASAAADSLCKLRSDSVRDRLPRECKCILQATCPTPLSHRGLVLWSRRRPVSTL